MWNKENIEDYKRCMEDIEYFAETHIKISHPVHGIIPIKLNDLQKEIIKNYKETKVFAKVADRQKGKTTIAAIILLHQALFNEYRVSLILAKRMEGSNYILELIFKMYENLPEHIRNAKIKTRNKTKLEFDNMCSIISAGSNTRNGIGRALSNLYIDESDYIESLYDIINSLYPCISTLNNSRMFALTSSKTLDIFNRLA